MTLECFFVMNDQVDGLDLFLDGHHRLCPPMFIANFGRRYKGLIIGWLVEKSAKLIGLVGACRGCLSEVIL
jgi:hypothetical protein